MHLSVTNWWYGWCVLYTWENEGVTCTYSKQCACSSMLLFLYHNCPSVFETVYLILSFILILILISLCLADWRHGWCVFCMCENEVVICMYGKQCAYMYFKAVGSLSYTVHLWNSTLILILSFVLILIVIHSSLANWWHGWCVLHVGEWAFNVRMVNKQPVNRDTHECRNFLAQPIVFSDLGTKHAIPFFPIRHFAG